MREPPISEIVGKIVQAFHPRRIVLFGSRARGEARPDIHHRKTIRLAGYDYAKAGGYFVTACAAGRHCLFGDVTDDGMQLNEAGRIVEEAWNDLPIHYPYVTLDAFMVMPNHFHGIIVLRDDRTIVGAGLKPAPTKPAPTLTPAAAIARPTAKRHALPEIVRAFKSFSARRINEHCRGSLRPAPTQTPRTAAPSGSAIITNTLSGMNPR